LPESDTHLPSGAELLGLASFLSQFGREARKPVDSSETALGLSGIESSLVGTDCGEQVTIVHYSLAGGARGGGNQISRRVSRTLEGGEIIQGLDSEARISSALRILELMDLPRANPHPG
jgi:hypothetical protein